MADLLNTVILMIKENPNKLAREYACDLNGKGFPGITKKELNRNILYKNNHIFKYHLSDDNKPVWSLTISFNSKLDKAFDQYISNRSEDENSGDFIASVSDLNTEDEQIGLDWNEKLELYPWQIRALDQWKNANYQGVVEAVTGSGKSRLAVGAIEAFLKIGYKIVVLVHTRELQNQWRQVLEEHLNLALGNQYSIGLLGNDHNDSLFTKDILIAIAASSVKRSILPEGYNGLVVVDECHHYGSEQWQLCLKSVFDARIGLTATYARDDNEMDALNDYFKKIVYKLDFVEARAEEVIAPFRIAFIGVNFDKYEKIKYDRQDALCKKHRSKLIKEFGLSPEPFSKFMKDVNALADSRNGYRSVVASQYRTALNQRKDILAAANQKTDVLTHMVGPITKCQRAIVFTQKIDTARNAAIHINDMGIDAIAIDSKLNIFERRLILDAYKDGTFKVISAPKLLDEGIDIPEADLAIVSAASRSRRQMIQRMGRVLRKKKDGGLAKIVILYVVNTSEDPSFGAHETFIGMILEAAESVKNFDYMYDADSISEYLCD